MPRHANCGAVVKCLPSGRKTWRCPTHGPVDDEEVLG